MLEFLWKGKLGKWGLLKRVRFFFFWLDWLLGELQKKMEIGDHGFVFFFLMFSLSFVQVKFQVYFLPKKYIKVYFIIKRIKKA